MIVPDRGQAVDTPAPTGSPPQWLPVDAYSIPRELTADPSWYPGLIRPKAGKVGTWDKIPADPQTAQPAKWSDPATRCTFSDAWGAYERDPRFKCIGYMLHADAGVTGVDLDRCVTPDGTIAPWAQQIVDSFPGAYWERSISGTGLRGFCRGSLGDVGGVRSKIEGCSVEVYADQRFLVVTGQALATVEQLPDLQAAIDALRARLTAGRVRVTGTAIGSGLIGATISPSAEVLAIVEGVMSGRHGQRLSDVWFRDALHVAGASEDDWALGCEIAYQAIRLGHRGDELAQLVEQTMRAGPHRSKWDEPRGTSTWLAQDVANAIATVLKRLGDRPITAVRPDGLVDVDEAAASHDDKPAEDETWQETIARLERQLAKRDRDLAEERLAHANTRSVAAVQMTRIRELGTQRDELADRLAKWKATLSNPKLKPADRIVGIALGEPVSAAQKAGQARIHIRVNGIVNGWGIPRSTFDKSTMTLTEHDGAPFGKRTEHKIKEWGPNPESYFWVADGGDVWATLAAYDPQLPQRGGRHPRQPECKDDPGADLIERKVLLCAVCHKPVTPATQRRLHRHFDDIGKDATHTVSGVNLGLHFDDVGGHDGEEQGRAASMVGTRLIRPEVDAWKKIQPAPPDQLAWFDEWSSRPSPFDAMTEVTSIEPPDDPAWSPSIAAIRGGDE